MTKTIAVAALALLGAATLATPGQAQDLTAMYDAEVARQNADFDQLQAGMVRQNLDDPQVMAAYRAGACGPGLTPQQFAYKWAATGGCTVQGMQDYMDTSNRIAARDQAAWRSYRWAQAARARAMQMQQESFYRNQYRRGMQLDGWRYGYAPDGQVVWYR